MKSALSEGKFLLLTLAAIFLLITIHFFRPQLALVFNPNNYAGIHTVLEFFSISISVTIFLYGLKNYEISKSRRMLHLLFTFLIIAAVDLLHTLSYKGMPHLFSESSIPKATWFWVIARVLESSLMLMLITLPNRKMKRDYRTPVVLAGIFLSAFLAYFINRFNQYLPVLFVEGAGTTSLKNGIEYFVCTLQFISIVILLYQYYLEKSGAKLTITLAFVFLLLSELIFTTYHNIYDLDNFTGHLFKVIGYYYILKAFYFNESLSDMDKLSSFLYEYPGLIFQLEARRNECVCTFCEGELLAKLPIFSDELNSKQIFRIVGHSARDYCLTPGKEIEQKTFQHEMNGKSYFISIKRIPASDEIRTIIGMVMEICADDKSIKSLVK